MNRIKNSLIAFAGLSVLIAVIAGQTQGTSQGQSGGASSKDVSVINTPTVNVANSPTVNIAENASVGIDPARNTVKVVGASREPVMIDLGVFQLVDGQAYAYRTDTFLIPEGKRLVVEQVYGESYAAAGNPVEFSIRSTVSGQVMPEFSLLLPHTIQTSQSTGNPYKYFITQPVKLYVTNPIDDGKVHGVEVFSVDMAGGPTTKHIYLAGYLEPL